MHVGRQRSYKTSGYYGVKTAEQKKAARNMEVALHRLRLALVGAKKVNLHRSVFGNFPMDAEYIEIWRARAAKAAATKPVGKSKPENLEAVELAAMLLRHYNIRLTKARTGKLYLLAAVFSGNPDAKNLYEAVRDYVNRASAKEDARRTTIRANTSA